EQGVLARGPRPADAPVFDRRMIEQVALGGVAIGTLAFLYYQAALSAGVAHAAAQGAVLWLLVWCENAHCFNCRSERRSTFRIPLAHNPLLIGAVIGTQLLQVAVLGVPGLRDLLSLTELTIADGIALAVPALAILAVIEIYKRVRR
ncbi:MAG TPA: cation-translocating P-type ATPase C-terminal domain-containing protein, partial [Alphaproteobacteria bacterium]